jgi:hypothetical protein
MDVIKIIVLVLFHFSFGFGEERPLGLSPRERHSLLFKTGLWKSLEELLSN